MPEDCPLSANETVTTLPSRTNNTIHGLLGDGSGGFVYRVGPSEGEERAIKLFKQSFMAIDPGTPARVRRLLDMGSPSPAFAWPQEMTIHERTESGGYSMALVRDAVPANRLFEPSDDGRPLVGPPLDIRARALVELARAMGSLLRRGLVIKDLSGANVLVKARTGEVAILDTDSIDEPGRGEIFGTPGYQAFESVAQSRPQSAASDLHSLAVVAFELLTGSHPLRGQRWWQLSFPTPEDLDELFIHHPIFIFDPNDDRNRPLSPRDDPFNDCGGLASLWWWAYPPYVQELFTSAFTSGLREPDRRIPASKWDVVATRFLDSLAPCPRCGQLNSIDVTWGDGPLRPCWNCESPVVDVPHLQIGKKRVTLVPGRVVFPRRVDDVSGEPRDHLLTVETHDATGDLGLKNSGLTEIEVAAPDGRAFTLAPRNVVLVTGLPRGTRIRTTQGIATLVKR